MIRRRITGIVIAVVMIALWLLQGLAAARGAGWPLWSCPCGNVRRVRRARRKAHPRVGMATRALRARLPWETRRFGLRRPLTTIFCMLALAGVIIRGQSDFDSAVATLFPPLPGMLITMLFPLQDLQPPPWWRGSRRR